MLLKTPVLAPLLPPCHPQVPEKELLNSHCWENDQPGEEGSPVAPSSLGASIPRAFSSTCRRCGTPGVVHLQLLCDVISTSTLPRHPLLLWVQCRVPDLLLLLPHELLLSCSPYRMGVGCAPIRKHPNCVCSCLLCWGVHFKGYLKLGPVTVWTHGWSDT